MNETKRWYEEVKDKLRVHSMWGIDFIFYKGFKLSKLGDDYDIQDVRHSNLYSVITKKCYHKFLVNGFIKGADIISFERDKKRIISYTKKTENLYQKRKKFKKEMLKDKRLNKKRIRNINRKIDEHIDLLFFYKTRTKQFNYKYNEEQTKNQRGTS